MASAAEMNCWCAFTWSLFAAGAAESTFDETAWKRFINTA